MHELTGIIGLLIFCAALFLVVKDIVEHQKNAGYISLILIVSSLFLFILPAILFAANGALIDYKKIKTKRDRIFQES